MTTTIDYKQKYMLEYMKVMKLEEENAKLKDIVNETTEENEEFMKENALLNKEIIKITAEKENCETYTCDNCELLNLKCKTLWVFTNYKTNHILTYCDDCGNDLHEEMRNDGYTRDDDE